MNNIHPTKKGVVSFGIVHCVCIVLGIIATLLCSLATVKEGLEILFLLPIAFTICVVVFFRAFSYWRDNIAFVIIFATIAVRYLLTPALMTISGTAISTVSPSSNYYRLAIIIQIFELIATLAVIDYVWTRHKKKIASITKLNLTERINFKLTWVGALFLVALAVLVLVRGHLPDLIERYSTWWDISEDFSAVYFYDYISVEIIKSVIGIVIISFFAKYYHRTSSKFEKFVYYTLAAVAGVAMTIFYMYDQRTALVQLIISSMVVILAFFPRKRRLSLMIFGVGGAILVAYVFATGSMRYEFGGTNDGMLTELCQMAELYVSGPTMVAITQENYDWVRENMSFMTYVSDFITTSHVFGMFPFLRGINDIVANIPTTNALFVESLGGLTYILPNYSLWTYYATDIFGWIFEILSIYLVIKIIGYVDEKRTKSSDACYYYALAYVETLLGQAIFVNNTFLLWHAFTNLPFWLMVFVFVNNFGNKIKLSKLR